MSESQNEVVDLSADPFSPENIGVLHFITLARIYDVLMADLTNSDPEAAKRILKLHAEGKLMGPPPNMTGEFLTAPTVDDNPTTPNL